MLTKFYTSVQCGPCRGGYRKSGRGGGGSDMKINRGKGAGEGCASAPLPREARKLLGGFVLSDTDYLSTL